MVFSTGVSGFADFSFQTFCGGFAIMSLIFLIFTLRNPRFMLSGCILIPLILMMGGGTCAVGTLIFGEMAGAIVGVMVSGLVFVFFSLFAGWFKKARP